MGGLFVFAQSLILSRCSFPPFDDRLAPFALQIFGGIEFCFDFRTMSLRLEEC